MFAASFIIIHFNMIKQAAWLAAALVELASFDAKYKIAYQKQMIIVFYIKIICMRKMPFPWWELPWHITA